MENIFQKYERIRRQIKDGDLILFHGTKIIAKTIQYCDNAYWNHIGVVVEKHGALFIVDANGNGVQADRLSYRISKYKSGNFTIIQPLVDIEVAMVNLLKRSDDKWLHYDFRNGIKELFNRKFGWNLEIKMRDEHCICSSNDEQYVKDLEIMTIEFSKLRIPFPQDYIRYLDLTKAKILI